VGPDCGRIVLQHSHDCPVEAARRDRRDKCHLGAPVSTDRAAGHVGERGGGALGLEVQSPRFWVSAQSVVLGGERAAVGGMPRTARERGDSAAVVAPGTAGVAAPHKR